MNSCLKLSELTCADIKELPSNFLSLDQFLPSQLNPEALNCAILRGLTERDPLVIWSFRLLELPKNYNFIWKQAEIWKIYLIQKFSNGKIEAKRQILAGIKMFLNNLAITTATINDLIMINVSIFKFYLDLLELRKKHFETEQILNYQSFAELRELKDNLESLFDQIKFIKNRNNLNIEMEIFDNLNLESAILVGNRSNYLHQNPFYYNSRIEVFEKIVQNVSRGKLVPFVFADWFCNLYFIFDDVISIMSFDLLMSSWKVFISNEASIEAICNALIFLEEKINEDDRLLLAKEIPMGLIPEFYKRCPIKNIPEPFSLIPYELRRAEYLKKKNRKGSVIINLYNIEFHWQPIVPHIIKIINIFEQISTNEMDLFETTDTFFNLRNRLIGLSRFLENLLQVFLEIKEWYIPLDKELIPTIIPSILFPPQLMPILVKLLVRCRQMSCNIPFKLCKNFMNLVIRADGNVLLNEPEDLEKLIDNHMRYVQNFNNHLPRLTRFYELYFAKIFKNENEINSNCQNLNLFSKTHFYLRKITILLWTLERDTESVNITELRRLINKVIRTGIDLFNEELKKQELLGFKTFSENELYKFLFN